MVGTVDRTVSESCFALFYFPLIEPAAAFRSYWHYICMHLRACTSTIPMVHTVINYFESKVSGNNFSFGNWWFPPNVLKCFCHLLLHHQSDKISVVHKKNVNCMYRLQLHCMCTFMLLLNWTVFIWVGWWVRPATNPKCIWQVGNETQQLTLKTRIGPLIFSIVHINSYHVWMEWESVYTCNCFVYQFDIKILRFMYRSYLLF